MDLIMRWKIMDLKSRNLIIVFGSSALLMYLAIFTVPLIQGIALTSEDYQPNQHTFLRRFRIKVEEGQQYTLSIGCSFGTGCVDPTIHIYKHALKLYGMLLNTSRGLFESIVFTAQHSGVYYITVKFENRGFFNIGLSETTGDIDTLFSNHLNLLKVFLLIVPLIFLGVGSILVFVRNHVFLRVNQILTRRRIKKIKRLQQNFVKKSDQTKKEKI